MKAFLAAGVVAALLAACASGPGAGSSDEAESQDVRTLWHLDAASLMAYDWQLESAVDDSGRPVAALQPGLKAPLVVHFAAATVSMAGGCNTQFGGYAVRQDKISFQRLAATMMACDAPRMRLDAALAERLKQPLMAEITGPSQAPEMEWTLSDGDVLRFVGRAHSRAH